MSLRRASVASQAARRTVGCDDNRVYRPNSLFRPLWLPAHVRDRIPSRPRHGVWRDRRVVRDVGAVGQSRKSLSQRQAASQERSGGARRQVASFVDVQASKKRARLLLSLKQPPPSLAE